MAEYTYEELADMHLTYGEAKGNGRAARRLYEQRFPTRRIPSHPTFASVDRRLRETGSFAIANSNAGRSRTARTPELEERVLTRFAAAPSTSTRAVADEMGVSQKVVWRILHEERMHPYHVQQVQSLHPDDYPRRAAFVQWMLGMRNTDPRLPALVLFSDEATFSREGIFNMHNQHVWSACNPHCTTPRKHQHRFTVNIWTGILGDYLVGPYILPDRLSGATYRIFLEHVLPRLLQAVPLPIQSDMWFMHDGAPAHFAITVRNFLNATYPARWIGRGGPVAWPPRSPDLNPLDFFFWGHMKSLVYETPVDSAEDLVARIVVAADHINTTPGIFERVRQSFLRRCELCNDTRGRHFEHLL